MASRQDILDFTPKQEQAADVQWRSAYIVPGPWGGVEVDYTVRDDELPVRKRRQGWRRHPNPQHWYNLKRRHLKRTGGRCPVCRRKVDLQLHHNTYIRWGRERMKDVCILCDRCHELFSKNGRLAA